MLTTESSLSQLSQTIQSDDQTDAFKVASQGLLLIDSAFLLILIFSNTVLVQWMESLVPPVSPLLVTILLLVSLGLNALMYYRPGLKSLFPVQLLCIGVAAGFGMTRFFSILYMTNLARFSLQVNTKNSVLYALLICCVHLFSKELHYQLTEKAVFYLSFSEHCYYLLVLGRFIEFVMALFLVLLAVLALKSERSAFVEREKLNMELAEMSQELERVRLAREIHDSMGHTLTAINLQFEILEKVGAKKPAMRLTIVEKIEGLILQLRKEMTECLGSVRDDFNLHDSLQSTLMQYEKNGDFKVEIELDLPRIKPDFAHEIFSIVKEASYNVKKYANASKLRVKAQIKDDAFTVIVVDDGAGFDVAKIGKDRFGVRGMSERATKFGGTVNVESEVEVGTTVIVSAPLSRLKDGGKSVE